MITRRQFVTLGWLPPEDAPMPADLMDWRFHPVPGSQWRGDQTGIEASRDGVIHHYTPRTEADARISRALDGERTLREIVAEFAREFQRDPVAVREDVMHFVEWARARDLLGAR